MLKKLLVLWVGLGLVMATAATLAQDGYDFEEGATLVVEHGERDTWDRRFTGPGAVVYHDGLFHLFRNGYVDWPQPSQVGYLTSPDGLNWTETSEDPIFWHDAIPFDGIDLALVNSAIITPDGQWAFYFNLVPSAEDGLAGVFRATADDPLGEWVVDSERTLAPGGAWDVDFIGTVDVVWFNEAYHMYYAATDADGTFSIGLATSDDGRNWQKNAEPVLVADREWENDLNDPRVVVTEDGLTMLYSSINSRGTFDGYGLATSIDGLNWEKGDDLFIDARLVNGNVWFPELAYQDGEYFIYLEVERPRGFTDIWVNTFRLE